MKKVKLAWILSILSFCPFLINYHLTPSDHTTIPTKTAEESLGKIPPGTTPHTVELRDTILMYNRIPKSGSTTLISLLEELHGKPQINVGIMTKKFWLRDNQDSKMICEHLSKILDHAKQNDKPSFAIGHVAFVDPERDCQINNAKVIYMNQVRHPVHAFISNYHYSKNMYETQNRTDEFFQPFRDLKEYSIPPTSRMHNYMRFCGYGDTCWNPNNKPEQIIMHAKASIEKFYTVVGILEELKLSLKVYERLLPQYFNGISQLYSSVPQNQSHLNYVSYEPTSPEAWRVLSEEMKIDIQFYDYLKQRLYYQAQALKLK